MTEFQQSHSLYRLRNCSEVTCLRWLSSYTLGLEFTSELPSPFTSAPGAPIQLSGVHVIPPSPELEALKIQDIFFSYESGFCWLLEKSKTLKQVRTAESYLQERRWGELPSSHLSQRPPDSQLCRWGLLGSTSPEDCLMTEEWFDLACDAKIHCREH